MADFKAVSAVFIVLTVVFGATTGYLIINPMGSAQTITSTVTTTATAQATAPVSTSGGSRYTVNLAYSPTLGVYLANGTGWTLYLFTKDTVNGGASSCYGQCQTFWPPFSGSASGLSLPPGLNASSFGTITRTDGTKQLTYEGWPLYFYAGDKAVGQTNGQNKAKTWFVVNVPSISIPANVTITTATATSSGSAGY